MDLMALSCALKLGKMVKFVLCAFYRQLENGDIHKKDLRQRQATGCSLLNPALIHPGSAWVLINTAGLPS